MPLCGSLMILASSMWRDLIKKSEYSSNQNTLKIGLSFLSQSENLNLALYNANGDNLLMTNIQQCKEQPHLLW